MEREKLVLPSIPPREYTLRNAYQGRVWRTPLSVFTRELFFWALGLTLIGIALDHGKLLWWGAVTATGLGTCSVLASLFMNRRRVNLIRRGVGAKAIVGRPRRIPLFHELFRGTRESTYRLSYEFTAPSGESMSGAIWLCGCARQYFPAGSTEFIAYDENQPKKSVPLRVAVMVAPH